MLVAFVRREQGLVLSPGNPKRLRGLADVLALGARMAMRQQGTGAQMLLDVLLKRAGASTRDVHRVETPALTGPDLAEIVRAGQADCGVATRAAARSAGLDFVPLVWENFDLAMRQRSYFRPAMLTVGSSRSPSAEMRETGLRGVLVYCHCGHHIELSADRWADDVRLSDLEPRFVCQGCGSRGADVRPRLRARRCTTCNRRPPGQ